MLYGRGEESRLRFKRRSPRCLLVFGLGFMGGCAMGQKYSDSEPNHFDGFVVDIRETQETT